MPLNSGLALSISSVIGVKYNISLPCLSKMYCQWSNYPVFPYFSFSDIILKLQHFFYPDTCDDKIPCGHTSQENESVQYLPWHFFVFIYILNFKNIKLSFIILMFLLFIYPPTFILLFPTIFVPFLDSTTQQAFEINFNFIIFTHSMLRA